MSRGGRIKKIFPGGNTAQGFYSFYDSILEDMERVFILKGGPGTGKSTFMRRIGLAMADRGYNVEFLCCSSDKESLDGVVISELKVALVDGTAPHVVDPKYPGAVDEIINLGEFWDEETLYEHKKEIMNCNKEIWDRFKEAFAYMRTAKEIHDEWESYYLEGMDFGKADRKASQLIEEIFSRKPLVRHLFAGAITPEGPVNYIENITEHIKNRYIIKGKPGTGKSTLAKKISQAAIDRGYSVDIYHCSFDPDSVDMLVITELSVAIIDGTAPHEFNPTRDGDYIVNMLDCVDEGIVAMNANAIANVEEKFDQVVNKAMEYMLSAKKLHDKMEKIYIEAMDFESVDNLREKVLNQILSYTAEKKEPPMKVLA